MTHARPFLAPLLAAIAGAAGASEADASGAGGARPGPAATTPDAVLAQVAEGGGAVSTAQVAADARFADAQAEFRAGRFAAALDAVQDAIHIYPAHERAQQLRDEVLAVLGLRANRLQMAARWFGDIQDVKTQELAVRLAGLMESGDRHMAAADYAAAELDYDRVQVALATFPYQFDWGDLPEQLAAKVLQARARSRQAELARARSDRDRAQAEALERGRREEEARKAKVDELLARARAAYDRRDYRRTEVDAWNAYELDRRRDDARELYLKARRQGHERFDATYREESVERVARVHEEIHKSLIPQTELLVYPEDWQRRVLRKPREIGGAKEEPWMATIRGRLQQQVSFEFEDTPFDDVVAFFRKATGINIIVDPAVGTQAGTITLRAKDMRFADALKWVLELAKLHMAVQNEAVYISNQPISGAVALRIYDIADLINPVRDFPGRELAFSANAGGGGGKGAKGGGFDLFQPAAGGDVPRTDPTQLVDFIKKNVDPASWTREGVGLEQRSGSTLFVSQSPETHRLIEQLLDNVRKQQALQVHVDIRVLDVRKGFYEEIGVEFHNNPVGMLNASSPGGYAHQAQNEAYSGTLYQELPANATSQVQGGYNAGTRGAYGRGLQVESSLHMSNFLGQDQVNAILAAAEDETDVRIVQDPSITCFNGQRANASFITQFAYIGGYDTVAGNSDPQVQVLSYGDIIDVRPVVSSDRKYVTLELRPSSVLLQGVFLETISGIRNIGGNGGAGGGGVAIIGVPLPIELPNIVVREMRATVTIPDRASMITGGFNNSLRQRTHTGVPFLSHIPFLGRLFSRNGVYDENRQLSFLLTTRILDLNEEERTR